MKTFTKRFGAMMMLAVITMIMLSLGIGDKLIKADAASKPESNQFFYNQLSTDERAQRFYHAFEDLEESNQFKNGKVEYDLVEKNVLSKEEVTRYVEQNDMKIPQSYGAGRDAYLMDHPDLFYVDVFGTSISAGQQGKEYVAYLDSSRTASLYLGSINSPKEVQNAIDTYETTINKIVKSAQSAGGAKEQIEYVNQYIAEHTEYSFGTTIKDGRNVEGPEAAYISTAYGSLVNGKAICGGYAKGFKAVMDRLGIPCVCVQGYSLSSQSSTFVPHMWNYVQLEDMWYAVDTTWNDTSNKINEWLLVGGQKLQETHIEDGIVSSSGYGLNYPALKPYNYGVDTDDNGMCIEGVYKESTDGTGKVLSLTVSFEDKSVKQLQSEGKYVAFRTGEQNGKEMIWTPWLNCLAASDMFPSMFKFNETDFNCLIFANTEYIQFGLIDYAADISYGATYPDKPEYGDNAGKECFYVYDAAKLTDEHFIGAVSAPYHNNGFGSYVAAPGAAGVYPANTGSLPVDKTYTISVTYNDTLELVDGASLEDVQMDFYVSRGNDTVKEHAILTDFQWDGDKKITFTFTPSKMFIHNNACYSFVPTNLVGKKSKKCPDPFDYYFKGKSVVCSKIFNDGRLYMNVFGEPKMLDDSDVSITDFKDENGNYYAQSQRSQLLLVASKPTVEQENKMADVLKQDTAIKDADIVTSSSYEINLQICGVVQKVPNGSYMQVAFGFPEGYSPDDAGTTFKIYHYKHDDKGNITGVEEIPVIITQYGLIAQVKSFSPFTIVQLKNTSEAVSKNSNKSIYANVNGIGGKIVAKNAGSESGIIEVSGDSITYDIVAEQGYQIANVILNGTTLSNDRYANGKLVLTKEELADSNMLEVTFVTQEAVKSYEDRGISISTIDTNAKPDESPDVTPDQNEEDNQIAKKTNNTGIIIACVVVAVALVAAGTGGYLFFKKKQKKNK